LQDKEDYIRQTRAKVKQAILQHLHNKKEGNVSLNEKLGAVSEDLKSKKIENLKQAYESIFFLEELDQYEGEYLALWEYKHSGQKEEDYLITLSPEKKQSFNEQKAKINERIALRLEYVEKLFHEDQLVTGLKSSQGMYYLSHLLAQSAFYADRRQLGKRKEQSFAENVQDAKEELLGTIPVHILSRLDVLHKQDKHLLYELYCGALSYASSIPVDEDVKSGAEKIRNQRLKHNIQYVENYVKLRELGNVREEHYRTNFTHGNLNYNYIVAVLEHDFETKDFEYQNFSADAVKMISYDNRERGNDLPISSSVSQNIIYRLAKEFYGYT